MKIFNHIDSKTQGKKETETILRVFVPLWWKK